MKEIKSGRFGLVEKASEIFGRARKVIPAEECTVEEAVEGIGFGLLAFRSELDMASCSEFPQTALKILILKLAMRNNRHL